MDKKLISIIIATYNVGKTIERCLKSIIHQKSDQIELLIVDGNSKDNTMDIINQYVGYIDFCVTEPDKGIYDAWNKALNYVTGDWVMFIGADDIILPDSLNKYITFLQNTKVDDLDLISGRCEMINQEGKLVTVWGNPYCWNEFRRYMKISHGSSLHNKKLFQELGGFDLRFKICADYEFLLRKKLKTAFINQPIIQMQLGGMSYTVKGQIETYNIRHYRKSIPQLMNIFYLVKGIISLYAKYLFWR